jgi:ADP-heptose:LPS heptosyltransferase
MNILFVTATRIGDAVLSTGLLGHLVDHHPGAQFTIAAGPLAAPLFEAVPGLARLIAMPKRQFGLHWAALYRAVAAQRWDLVVDLRGSALAYLLLADERRVMAKGDAGEHRVRQLARLYALDPPPAPRLWLGARHDDAAAALVPAGPFLAVAPAANWRGKEWRAERFARLVQRLTAPDGPLPLAPVAVIAAAHERAQAEPVLASLPAQRRVDLIGGHDLLAVAAVLRRAALFVGNDTGLMHIAAAVGTPTLGLFGPSPAAQYAPWGKLTAIATTTATVAEMFPPGFDHRATGTLMDGLSVEAAEAAARGLWERVVGAAA